MGAACAVLGLDAAWTLTNPSGVALCRSDGSGWRCLAVAPSYAAFLALARGEAIDWDQPRFEGGRPDVAALLAAARQLSGTAVDLIAVDMPLSTVPIVGRRLADGAVSHEFGGRGCAAHSPGASRPGALGAQLGQDLLQAGYPLATAGTAALPRRCTIEVYPHPALLSLLPWPYRWPYKISKSKAYWSSKPLAERARTLLDNMRTIKGALSKVFGPVDVPLPDPGSALVLSRPKRYEDALDAIVCAWVGAQFLDGKTVPLGDETAAIWCPKDVVRGDG